MYRQVDFFRHDWHSSANGANLRCDNCHTQGLTRNAQSAKKCTACHPTYKFVSNNVNPEKKYLTLSYTDAMHNLCVSCHIKKSKILKNKQDLPRCTTCHKTQLPENLTTGIDWKINLPHFNDVILPEVKQDINE